jgi:hypothetical protein
MVRDLRERSTVFVQFKNRLNLHAIFPDLNLSNIAMKHFLEFSKTCVHACNYKKRNMLKFSSGKLKQTLYLAKYLFNKISKYISGKK